MVPSNFTESQRTEVSKVKWFTDRVSFVSSLSDHLSRTRMSFRADETLKSWHIQIHTSARMSRSLNFIFIFFFI